MKLIFPKMLISLPLILAAAGFCTKTLAQTADDDAKVVYPASYFVEWSPVTAQDMLNRIPGVSGGGGGGGPGGGGGGRGLGGGGGDQILIDGKRVAGKNNQAGSQLSRIAASKVSQIEIIRSSSAALDVRGSQVINIVLLEALTNSTISYEINADRYQDGHVQPGGKIAYTGQTGELNYVLSAEAEPRHNYTVSRENSRLGDWSPNDEIREDRTTDQTSYTYTANLGYVLNEASSVRFNALYSENDSPTEVDRSITNLRVTPNTIRRERDDIPGEQANWEIGGDYQYNFASGNRFRFLFISNENDRSSIRERYLAVDDSAEEKNLFLKSASTTTERIVRSSYTMGLREDQDLEMGVERAQTTLDSSLLLGLPLSTGTPSAAYGGLVPSPVSNANSTVEEIRYEPFVVHNWQISPRMTLESSLIYEMSEITQSGDISNQRDFAFFKPSLDWRFNVTPEFQLKAILHKTVRQLSFSDFVSSSNNRDLDSNTEAGNANLRQEQVWRTEFSAEYRLPNDQGVIDGNISYMKHFDVIERIDVSTSTGNLQSANGNIGDGIMYNMNLNAAIRMNIIKLPNLLVTANLNVQDSEITDPFLGIDRRFENFQRGRFNMGFRHDIPGLKMNYGLNWSNRFDGGMKRYDIDNIETQSGKPYVNAFLQFVAFEDITFRFDARNATSGANCRKRERFLGPISSGIITETEFNCFNSGRVLSLKVSGNF